MPHEPTKYNRNQKIMTVYRNFPDMTLKQIGEQFGLTPSGVSQIVNGRRGKRRESRLSHPNTNYDPELIAVRLVMDALHDLDEKARQRIVMYALNRLKNTTPFSETDSYNGKETELAKNST